MLMSYKNPASDKIEANSFSISHTREVGFHSDANESYMDQLCSCSSSHQSNNPALKPGLDVPPPPAWINHETAFNAINAKCSETASSKPVNFAQSSLLSAPKPGFSSTKPILETSPSVAPSRRGRLSPPRLAYKTRRAAVRVLTRLSTYPEEVLTEQDKTSLEWAKKVVAEHEKSAASKRQCAQGDQTTIKRAKVDSSQNPTTFFSDTTTDPIFWVVVDRSKDDGSISPENWQSVRIALLKVYADVLERNPGPPPCCRDAGWFQGRFKMVACKDQRSADLYREAISYLGEVWPGSRLVTVPKEEFRNKPRSTTWIPAEHSDPREVLELIQLSNPHLPTHNWRVVQIREVKGNKRQAMVILNDESLIPLEECRGIIGYGFSSITLAVYSKDLRDYKAAMNKRNKSQDEVPTSSQSFDDSSSEIKDCSNRRARSTDRDYGGDAENADVAFSEAPSHNHSFNRSDED